MPMSHIPRRLLTGWVSHSEPADSPLMTWRRTFKKALKNFDPRTYFKGRSTNAANRNT